MGSPGRIAAIARARQTQNGWPLHYGSGRALAPDQCFLEKIRQALYFVFYNWTRIHKSLRVTPAMAAGLTDRIWDMADVVKPVDDYEAEKNRPSIEAA